MERLGLVAILYASGLVASCIVVACYHRLPSIKPRVTAAGAPFVSEARYLAEPS